MQYSAAALVVAFGFIVFHEWGRQSIVGSMP